MENEPSPTWYFICSSGEKREERRYVGAGACGEIRCLVLQWRSETGILVHGVESVARFFPPAKCILGLLDVVLAEGMYELPSHHKKSSRCTGPVLIAKVSIYFGTWSEQAIVREGRQG